MVNTLIAKLNEPNPTFKIWGLYEDNEIDYVLLCVESQLIAVEVDYSGDISFRRIPKSKRSQVLRVFCSQDDTDEFGKFAGAILI